MWEDTGNERRTAFAAAAATLIALLATLLGAAPAAADPNDVTVDNTLELREDGSLAVTTVITAPAGRAVAQRLPLSVPVENNRTQHFTVSDTKAENGTATAADGALQVSAPGGRTTVTYVVRGTVSDGPDLQQFTWPVAAGYTADIATMTASFTAPTPQPDSPLCGVGQVGERRMCTLTQTDASGRVSMQQNGLPQGKIAVFTTLLPAGTVTADARFSTTEATAGSQRSTGGLVVLSIATVLALAAIGYAVLRRRADAAAAGSAGPTADPVVPSGSGTVFASPDGVLPGQVGALLDARVAPSDIGATVLDLAVRGYLWIAELPGGDFQISRRAPLDGAVTAAERAVVDAVLPGGAETTTTSELAGGARRVEFAAARAAIRAEVAERGWVRGKSWAPWAFALAGVGAAAALVCAFMGSGVLYALAVLVLALGLAAALLALPGRTVAGSRLAAGVGGMRAYLISENVASRQATERSILFERAIPYAHAFGDLRAWLGTWGGTATAPLDWYRSAHGPVSGLATLSALLDGIAAQAAASERADERD
ncbi:DUF2207 domain-containing protein [Tsukamurella sp. 1534]|uniref:DUF2207 family protein n=1 Tax=Tsukamurella sp. 1534 TaxID=1151061 RepID=UPI0002EE7F7A|nr:DUF2207 domain-containing protein [Tsukamurella sp. 1534]